LSLFQGEISAIMPNRKKPIRRPQNALDTLREKRRRGRPWKIRPSEVSGRAENYRSIFRLIGPEFLAAVVAATTSEEVILAFENRTEAYAREFVPRFATDILQVTHEPKFPKRSEAQINFLADSLAGRPNVEPRTSRDICLKERAKERAKSPHRIIRKEFYIECSCGYTGPALNDACRKCGALISRLPEILSGNMFH
jgi:hypothetical protein